MLYRVDKFKILQIFIIIVITVLLITLAIDTINKDVAKQKREILATRDTRTEPKIQAEGISRGYLKIINIAGSEALKTFKEDYRDKMEPALYESIFEGLGETGFNNTYKKYKITDIMSTQTQTGGTTTVKVRMVVELEQRKILYKTEVVNGRLREIQVLGTKEQI